jgi:hypothetical protein
MDVISRLILMGTTLPDRMRMCILAPMFMRIRTGITLPIITINEWHGEKGWRGVKLGMPL